MKIHIRKTVQVPEIGIESGTLRNLLDCLLRPPAYFAKEIIDPAAGNLPPDGLFRTELNGIPRHSLSDGLARHFKTMTLLL